MDVMSYSSALIRARYPTLKVEALETARGVRVGDRLNFGGYTRMDGAIEPLVPCTVQSVTYVLGCGVSYYRLDCICEPGYFMGRIEGAERYFTV
jgi:hypothetical protein